MHAADNQPVEPPRNILLTYEVAAMAGVGPRVVLQAIRAERLPAEKIGRSYLIRLRDAEAWVGQRGSALGV